MSQSVLRRYTPPTCTLEILAKGSPLSRWAGQPVLTQLRFRLHLDDPKLPKEQWVTLQGDRTQLEDLSEIVSSYVQRLLEVSPPRWNPLVRQAGEAGVAVLPAPAETDLAPTSGSGMGLRPQVGLAHSLSLGSLATPETGETVNLSTLQLFDLANALDDYTTDVVALPSLERSGGLKLAAQPWVKVAAAALLVVGFSASLVKLLDNGQSVMTSSPSQGASSSDQRIANQIPADAAPGASPLPGSDLKLPPPPPVGSTVPAAPGLPTVKPAPNAAAPAPAAAPARKPPVVQVPNPSQAKKPQQDQIAMSEAAPTVAPPAPAITPPLQPELRSAQRQAASGVEDLNASRSAAADSASGSTAFDTIPQVAEARSYFQQRWQPPQGLTQTLEYILQVAPNGSIQRITPLGQVSGDYVDRSGIPLVGEPFVSPIASGKSARMRLVLSPDGTVQTFLEKLY